MPVATPGRDTFTVQALNGSSPLTDASGNPVQVGHSNYVGVFGNPEITPDPGFLSTDPDRDITHRGMFCRNTASSRPGRHGRHEPHAVCGRTEQQPGLRHLDRGGHRRTGSP